MRVIRQRSESHPVAGRGRVAAFIAVSLASFALSIGCGDAPPPELGQEQAQKAQADQSTAVAISCSTPAEGCPCTTFLAVAECGKVIHRDGTYVTCAMAHTVCDGKTWGVCNGDRVVGPAGDAGTDAGAEPHAPAVSPANDAGGGAGETPAETAVPALSGESGADGSDAAPAPIR